MLVETQTTKALDALGFPLASRAEARKKSFDKVTAVQRKRDSGTSEEEEQPPPAAAS